MKSNVSLKNIKNLSALFIKDRSSHIDLFKNKKINKKSMWFWIILALIIALGYLSFEIVNYLKKLGSPQIFLQGFFLFLGGIIIIQAIMLTINIMYFSKDLELILPMPFKPIEILISKFNTILFFLYSTELMLAVVPLFMYGVIVSYNLLFFIKMIIALIIFPVFFALIVSMITLILVKYIGIIGNKDVIQIFFTLLLIVILFVGINYIVKISIDEEVDEKVSILESKLTGISKYFLTITPTVNILQKKEFFKSFLNVIYLIVINLFTFLLFIFIGKRTYLKQLLKINFYYKKRKKIKIDLNKNCKKNKIYSAYIKKEFKQIFKVPVYFIQCIYPIIITTFSVCVMIAGVLPYFKKVAIEKNLLEGISFNIEAVILILGILQLIGLINKTTVTAISREGKNAFVMKYLPIDFYKQFIYKNIPQILVNTICSFIILIFVYFYLEVISIGYIFMIFILSFLMFCINSYLLLIINLLFPKNNWETEYEIFKNNNNFILQYFLFIINFLVLYYLDKLFLKHDLNKSIIFIFASFVIIFVILNYLINKFKNKLFKKIK